MLNYNLNIIGALSKAGIASKDATITWTYSYFPITLGTFNIDAPNSTAVGITTNGAAGAFTIPYSPFIENPSSLMVASITGSTAPITGSTTMSIFITSAEYETVSAIARFGEKTNNLAAYAGYILSASIHPAAYQTYNVSASIEHVRGNLSNSPINWRTSGSTYTSAQFNIKKDESVLMVSSSMTSSASGSFNNEYALNLTASLNGKDYIWYSSSSFKQVTQSLIIPEIGINLVSYTTASYLTASWYALPDTASYNVTASVVTVPYEPYYIEEYIMIGGGGAGAIGGRNQASLSGGGGGAGAVVSGSGMFIFADSVYDVTVGDGGLSSEESGSASGADSSFVTASVYYLRAPGGGAGGFSGGSGGGNTGGPQQYQQNPGLPSLPATGSGTWFTNITGSRGGDGCLVGTPSAPAGLFSISGGGGGATGPGQNASCGQACNDGGLGGPGITNALVEALLGVSASLATGGDGGLAPGGCSDSLGGNGTDALYYGGGGQGGHGDGNSNNFWRGGYGKQGVFILKYLGTQKGRGGTVTYDGTYTYHTFTSSGKFYSTANLLPDYV